MTILSAVVQLIDGYSRQPAVAARARFSLDARPVLPQAKPEAFYAFVDLAAGHHRLQVSSPGYLDQALELEVPLGLSPQRSLADAIIACALEPGPLYAYPPRTTLVRGQVIDAHDRQPIAGVQVGVDYQDARGRARTRQTASTSQQQAGPRHHGRYAVALPGRLAPQAMAAVRFSHPGYITSARQVPLRAGSTQFLDAELTPLAR